MWKTIKYPTLCHSPLCYEWGVLKCLVVLNSQILENGPGKRKSVSSERIPDPKKESKVSRFGPNMVQQSRIISIHNLVAIHIRYRKENSLRYPDRLKSVQKLHYECSEPSNPWEFWGFDQRNCQSIWDLQFLLFSAIDSEQIKVCALWFSHHRIRRRLRWRLRCRIGLLVFAQLLFDCMRRWLFLILWIRRCLIWIWSGRGNRSFGSFLG